MKKERSLSQPDNLLDLVLLYASALVESKHPPILLQLESSPLVGGFSAILDPSFATELSGARKASYLEAGSEARILYYLVLKESSSSS